MEEKRRKTKKVPPSYLRQKKTSLQKLREKTAGRKGKKTPLKESPVKRGNGTLDIRKWMPNIKGRGRKRGPPPKKKRCR